MRIVIETIPHADQRYDTVGDWWWDNDTLHMRVSELGDWKKEMAIASHEMFEALVCKARGITQDQVDKFDMAWKPHGDYTEPGDDPAAPYHRAHQLAMAIEHILVDALDLDWDEHVRAVDTAK